MTTAQVVETSVTVNDKSPIQDYVHPADQTQPTFEMTPWYKPFTDRHHLLIIISLSSKLGLMSLKAVLALSSLVPSVLYFPHPCNQGSCNNQ